MKSKYLSSLSWSLIEQIFRLVANFFVSIVLIRYLGEEDFGTFSYVITIATFAFIISRFGLNDILIKILSDASDCKKENIILNAILVKLFISTIVYCITIFSCFILFDIDNVWLLLIATFGVFFQSFDVVEIYHQAIVNIKPIAILRNIQNALSVVLKLMFIFFELPLICFVFLFLIDFTMLFFGYCYLANNKKSIFKLNFSVDYNFLKKIIITSWPIALSNFAMLGYVKVDQIMIYHLLSASDLGIYAAAARLSESWYFIPTILATTLFPKMLSAKKESSDKYNKTVRDMLRIQILISVIVATITTLIGSWFVESFYGVDFFDSAAVLIIHIWAGVFISISRVSVKWFISEGEGMFFLYKSVIGLVVNIVLNYFLIQKFGIIGSAISLLITLSLVELFFYAATSKSRRFLIIILSTIIPVVK